MNGERFTDREIEFKTPNRLTFTVYRSPQKT